MSGGTAGKDLPIEHRDKVVALSGLILTFILAAFNQTALAPALSLIGADLGSDGFASWVISAFLVAATAAIPIYGKLGDVYGRKEVLVAAIALFIAGSAASAMAQSMLQLLAARILQGLGGGGLMTLAQATLASFISPRERGRYMVYFSTAYVVSSVAGPAIGGIVAERFGWRWLFAFNVPLGLLAIVVILLTLRFPIERATERRIDWLGAALLLVGLSCLAIGISAWQPGRPPGLLVPSAFAASLILGWAMAKRQKSVPSPIVPGSLLAHPLVPSAMVLNGVIGVIHMGTVIIVPLMLQSVLHRSPAESGLMMIPMLIAPVASSLLAGRAIAETGHYRRWYIYGSLGMAAGLLLLAAASLQSSAWLVFAGGVIWGLGFGPCFPVLMITGQSMASSGEQAAMTGLITLARSLGAAIGASLFPSLLFGAAIYSQAGPGMDQAGTAAPGALPFVVVFVAAALMAVASAAIETRRTALVLE